MSQKVCANCDFEGCQKKPYSWSEQQKFTCDDWEQIVLEIEVPDEICYAVSDYMGQAVITEAEEILKCQR